METDEFRSLQTLQVEVVDENFIRKWTDTAFDERVDFYKKNPINKIYEKLPVLNLPSAISLVFKSIFIIRTNLSFVNLFQN